VAEGFDPATLYRYITKGRSPATEVPGVDQLGKFVRAVEAAAGSGRKAAASVGVGETTWRRWRHAEARDRKSVV